jgi:hypothetical protein
VLSPNFAKKNQRSRSLSQAYNMSPVQKEQLLQYQKQRKAQNSATKSPGGSIKRKGLKEAVPEQQVMNPLYLLFSPLSSTSPTRSGPTLPLPRRYLPTRTTAHAHRTQRTRTHTHAHAHANANYCRRYGTVSGRSLNASDRVVSSFGLVARRKLSHNNSGSSGGGGGSGSGSADEPERVVINPLLRLRTDAATPARGPDSPLPMTRFTTSSGAAPTIVSSMSGPTTAVASPTRVQLTDRPTVSRVGSPSSPAAAQTQPKMAESTKRALAKTSASLIDTTRGPHDPNNAAANGGGDGADNSKPLKKTFSSPDFNPNKRHTITRQQQPQPHSNNDDDEQRAAAVSSSAESSSNDDEDDDDEEGNNNGCGGGEEGEEYEEEIEDEEAVGDGELRAARPDDTWTTTSEEDRGTDAATDIESGGGGGGGGDGSGSSSSIRSVPALNFSPLQQRLPQSSDSAEAQVVVNRSSSLQFEKLSSSSMHSSSRVVGRVVSLVVSCRVVSCRWSCRVNVACVRRVRRG